MAGGALIIVGALIVSIRFGQSAALFKLRLAVLMLACGFVLALATLIFKIFAIKVAFWTTTFWMFVGEALFGAALLMVGSYRRQFVALLRTNTAALLSINALERADQSRRRTGQSLCAAVRAVEPRAGDRLDDDAVRLSRSACCSASCFRGFGRENLSGRELAQKGMAAVFVALGVALVTR